MPWICPDTGKVFQTGLSAVTPPQKLLAARPFVVTAPPPPQAAWVPDYRSMYNNDRLGICVTAEEAFTKSCIGCPQGIPDDIVLGWARGHGVANGADLGEVLDWMAAKGFQVGQQLYNDGQKLGLDYSDETILRAAIAQSPVKIAMAANALPGGAGSRDGFYVLGSRGGRTDHCIAICGYGPAGWLWSQLDVKGAPLPSALQPNMPLYLIYTWSTIGLCDHAWIMGTCVEAWAREPATIGIPPLPEPTPPTPPVPPGPTPTPQAIQITITEALTPGDYLLIKMIPA